MNKITFTDTNGSFQIKNADRVNGLYFPIASESGLKSCLTPDLAGDAKLDQNHFILEPVSIDDLTESRSSRNFWLVPEVQRITTEDLEVLPSSREKCFDKRFSDIPAWSVTGRSAWQLAAKGTPAEEETLYEAGLMWQRVTRESRYEVLPVRASVTSFIPYDSNAEMHILHVEHMGWEIGEGIRQTKKTDESIDKTNNIARDIQETDTIAGNSDQSEKAVSEIQQAANWTNHIAHNGAAVTFIPWAAIPLYGRSADNIRDHRHVTSLLNRIYTTPYGVHLQPAMSFDERGHQKNETIYFVDGFTAEGKGPVRFLPVKEDFIGECGSLEDPQALREKYTAEADEIGMISIAGQEAIGAFAFEKVTLAPGESADLIIMIGAADSEEEIGKLHEKISSFQAAHRELERTKAYWLEKVNVRVRTGDEVFDQYMNWIGFQPELRRLFGCSFLPHHDYGRGGRGWRDLWQDCLALLLMDPGSVRDLLLINFAGVRLDGTNATIIGEKPGEFKADRNSITRVWMDHAMWPLMTTKLYLDQTGDYDFLFEMQRYFDDGLICRGTKRRENAREAAGLNTGTVLEHLLIENLTAIWEIGEHGCLRLRDADWNDALDMAGQRGESVAFTHAYVRNLRMLAELLRKIARAEINKISLLPQISILLQAMPRTQAGGKALLEQYFTACEENRQAIHHIDYDPLVIALRLEEIADEMTRALRKNQWLQQDEQTGWFVSYYDNDGQPLDRVISSAVTGRDESDISNSNNSNSYSNNNSTNSKNSSNGSKSNSSNNNDGSSIEDPQMLLTGQVFAIMGGIADEEQVRQIARAADRYLYDEDCGGYRLNTDFHEVKLNMGRMFGFAFGEKENGAVFSHMAVMYANALYSRGFAREGWKVLRALYRQAADTGRSRMLPGIPEYFGRGGRGLYSYLTGAASWYLLTVVQEMFGVRGEAGDLVVSPALLPEQFDEQGQASIDLRFAGRQFHIQIQDADALQTDAEWKRQAEEDRKSQSNEQNGKDDLKQRDRGCEIPHIISRVTEASMDGVPISFVECEVRLGREEILMGLDPAETHELTIKIARFQMPWSEKQANPCHPSATARKC